ncbi:UPF0739 protein C1orf74 homolog [Parasteatoda tepidariorum]|uniref:UPF0739 protein C1orf74 homolog n=1 Tax=Parasteatoda tepidariorum TaxID=114398 RepID=UPI00077F8313|nr:UPF0739 protein C1orf74 homolog [Parasteatoda tepidariorum]
MFKLFKNSRSARRHLPHILLNLHAIDKQLKPCYLWDAFIADVDEIQNYLNVLNSCGKINKNLSVFSVNDTHFVTQKEHLKNHAEIFATDEINLVDVSDSGDKPCMLYDDEKKQALKPIVKNVSIILNMLAENRDVHDIALNVDFSVCNLTTLYGALLGYPVLYWYSPQESNSSSTCLSMVPLVVYRVTNCKEETNVPNPAHKNNRLYDHQIFAFSTPKSLFNPIECGVNSWFKELEAKCENSMFDDLTLSRGFVTLPYISM